MSRFIEEQAEVSENERSSDEEPAIKRKKQNTKRRNIASSDEEDDNEEDDERAREEMRDFVVDEEENEANADDNKSEKSGSGSDDAEELLDDDLDLVNENIGRRVGGRVEISDDEEDRARIERDLFLGGGDDYDEPRDRRPVSRSASVSSRSSFDEDHFIVRDDEDNFIVHDGEARGRRRRRDRPRKNRAEILEAQEIFGFDDADLAGDGHADSIFAGMDDEEPSESKRQEQTLIGVIEPDEVAKHADKERDIIFKDVPERFQLRSLPVTPAEDDELKMESLWIQQRAFESCVILSQQQDVGFASLNDGQAANEKIEEVLKFIRNMNFEVPFIAFYRKEHIEPLLMLPDLWKIYEYDEKWLHFRDRKERLQTLHKRMENFLSQMSPTEAMLRKITEKDYKDLQIAQTNEEIMDCYDHFQLYYANLLPQMVHTELERDNPYQQPNVQKQTQRNDKYWSCAVNGPGAVADCFGLTPEQLAENFEYQRHRCISDTRTPIEVAQENATQLFPEVQVVLEAAVYVVAYRMSREPGIRRKLREMYRADALFRARPTVRSRKELREDTNHPLHWKRYIANKPVSQFEGFEYLEYQKAKKNGQMIIEIYVDNASEDSFLSKVLNQNYWGVDEQTEISLLWDTYRTDAIRMCLEKFLLPLFAKETHDVLLAEATDCALREVRRNFDERIRGGRYRPTIAYYTDEDGSEDINANTPIVRIIAIAPGDDSASETTAIALDQHGLVAETCPVSFRSRFDPVTRKREGHVSLRAFVQMCRTHRPHVIAIAATELRVDMLKRDIDTVISEAQMEGKLPEVIPTVFVTAEAARVYAKSRDAEREFPMYSPRMRLTVSVGRCLLDPLVEYAHLCNATHDYLGISVHPLQDQLPTRELQWCFQREFINHVSEVGVDINYCLEFPHTANVLQFVCGLGPRKAAHLLQLLRHQNATLQSRSRLVTQCGLGPSVFINAAGFIRIDVDKIRENADDYVEQLDGSRVHPETYAWARKMAIDALEFDESNDPATAIDEIIEAPDRLGDLDLDAFAEELSRQGFGSKGTTLYDIRAELTKRYKDLRQPQNELQGFDLFKELVPNPDLFLDGKLVHARVQRIIYKHRVYDPEDKYTNPRKVDDGFECPDCSRVFEDFVFVTHSHLGNPSACTGRAVGVSVLLDENVTGYIGRKELSDDEKSFKDIAEIIRPGQSIVCRVLEFDDQRHTCKLSCKSSVLQALEADQKDVNWDVDGELQDLKLEDDTKKRSRAKTNFTKRVISHQSFHNVTFADAERMLSTMSQGEAIIRPSSKSPNNLTVTWKVTDNIYQHVLIDEGKKKHTFDLGKELRINDEVFEDLDEILARYVTPLAEYVREVLNHKYYNEQMLAEDTAAINESLQRQKEQQPNRIPYMFTASKLHTGRFLISYRLRTPKHEYFTVTPDGFRFRQLNFASLDKMLDWFKMHFRDMPQR